MNLVLWREPGDNKSSMRATEVLDEIEARRRAVARSVVNEASELLKLNGDGTWTMERFLHGVDASNFHGKHS